VISLSLSFARSGERAGGETSRRSAELIVLRATGRAGSPCALSFLVGSRRGRLGRRVLPPTIPEKR